MDDDAFAVYVLNNAPRYAVETLEKIVHGLQNNITSRRWGKPSDLEIGSNIEATRFDFPMREYGTVVSMRPKGCTIEPPESKYATRIAYNKYAIRVLEDHEWNRVCFSFAQHHKKYYEELDAKIRERTENREAAITEREKNAMRPTTMVALNGSVELYRGAFVHAHDPTNDTHDYGVVVEMTPKKVVLSNNESDWESTVWATKREIEVLGSEQWTIVDAEQRRRKTEYEEAEKAGRHGRLPDYSRIAIVSPATKW